MYICVPLSFLPRFRCDPVRVARCQVDVTQPLLLLLLRCSYHTNRTLSYIRGGALWESVSDAVERVCSPHASGGLSRTTKNNNNSNNYTDTPQSAAATS